MGVFDRIILTIYTFALTFLSAAFVALAAGWLTPLDRIRTVLGDPNGRWAIGLTGSIFFVASVRLLYFGFRRRATGRAVVHDTDLGEVRISLEAVENLIARVARHQRGVREARPLVAIAEGRISAYLRIWVAPDVHIPELTGSLQREIVRQVGAVMGAEVSDVRIDVINVSEPRRSRVE